MPELPEVETTLRGLEPHLLGRTITEVILRRPDLRWPIPSEIAALRGSTVTALSRRAKYLLMSVGSGTAIWHLGMTGNMRVIPVATPPVAHDHVDWVLDNATLLRFHDPRRFGALLWQPADTIHPLLNSLGPEPLSELFDAAYLFARSRGRKIAVKAFLMDQNIVVGVGNIYANEALFMAGIAPSRAAGRVSLARYEVLVACIKEVLARAIAQGGTTLKDFSAPDGSRGYFVQELNVYGRGGEPCVTCSRPLKQAWIGQRATVWCTHCQK